MNEPFGQVEQEKKKEVPCSLGETVDAQPSPPLPRRPGPLQGARTEKGWVLSAQGIHKSYETGDRKLDVLKGIDLKIRKGEIISVVGPSGVGKSTLLHILGTLDRPTEGEVTFDSTNVFSLSDEELARFRNKTVGFVFQFHRLLPEFGALENVMMPQLNAQPAQRAFGRRAAAGSGGTGAGEPPDGCIRG
jgi:predicted ABC-type transport system involved in lysophospholipase L1 biosynthesis ATPase subunit